MIAFDPKHCTLCPRCCGADRTRGRGRCRMPVEPVLARASLHHWEEPPISGTGGAGTVFFSGCSLGCVFCQNDAISHRDFGRAVSVDRLRAIFWELLGPGANSGGYDRVETLRALEGRIPVYLPDLKFPDAEGARRYAGAEDYPEVARAAICEMVRQTGPYRLGPDGILVRGTLIRHLLLPGRLVQARAVMDWVAETFPPHTVLFSLMSQYVPWGRAGDYPEIDRRLRTAEIRAAERYMAALGLDGYAQGPEAARAEYIPSFDLTGV